LESTVVEKNTATNNIYIFRLMEDTNSSHHLEDDLDEERIKKAFEIQNLLESSHKIQCNWVTCLCVVTFDLELGQSTLRYSLKAILPKEAQWRSRG
jgi:hypothetical protein